LLTTSGSTAQPKAALAIGFLLAQHRVLENLSLVPGEVDLTTANFSSG
jgi:hypothetical protein